MDIDPVTEKSGSRTVRWGSLKERNIRFCYREKKETNTSWGFQPDIIVYSGAIVSIACDKLYFTDQKGVTAVKSKIEDGTQITARKQEFAEHDVRGLRSVTCTAYCTSEETCNLLPYLRIDADGETTIIGLGKCTIVYMEESSSGINTLQKGKTDGLFSREISVLICISKSNISMNTYHIEWCCYEESMKKKQGNYETVSWETQISQWWEIWLRQISTARPLLTKKQRGV